jgi:hypothetical protein
MKRFLVLSTVLMATASAIGCNCMRQFNRGAPCAPACMPAAPACAPTVGYGGDCMPGATVSEPYLGTPTPAGTPTVAPGPVTYTPAPVN